MEKIMIFGIAAMIGFVMFFGNKPWVTPRDPGQERITPCIEKPWVTPHDPGQAREQPCDY
ncbi:MAG: hypothetical protein WCK34_02540 [Bacteroidota bacterium]